MTHQKMELFPRKQIFNKKSLRGFKQQQQDPINLKNEIQNPNFFCVAYNVPVFGPCPP